jgi:hypothetical protein
MAQQRLGQSEQARSNRQRMRELTAEPRWVNDSESRACLAELELLLGTGE